MRNISTLSVVAGVLLAFFWNGGSLLAQSCNCTEYIYVNEVTFSSGGKVHKFGVTAGSGAISEVLVGGNAWYPGAGTSLLPFPHGLGADRNGFLYIGSTYNAPNSIRRLDCSGNIKPTFAQDPVNGFDISSGIYDLFNIDSYKGIIYSNGDFGRIFKWDPCTGALIGYVQLGDNSTDWGFSIDDNGRFYVSNSSGRIWAFTPTDADFISNFTFPPLVELNLNPTQGGALNPQYAGQGLQGITVDNNGNIYVVEGNRDAINTPSRLLKFTAAGAFVAAGPIDNNGTDNMGWNQMTGLVYSKTANKLYSTSLNPNEDCVFRWNTDLTPSGSAVGPVPGLGQAKGIAILSECCPTGGTVNVSACDATTTSRVSLADLLTCDGVICDGQWTLNPGSTNFTFNNCDVTGTPTNFPACATFTLTNAATSNAPCAPYTITVNATLLQTVTAQTIAGSATVCPTDDPAAFTIVTPASVTPAGPTITYQWQSSTVSCTAGFMDIPGAMSATYDPGPVTQTTYFRVIARITGCVNGVCEDVSNCVTLTLGSGCPTPPSCVPPALSVNNATVCIGSTVDLSGLVVGNVPLGILTFHSTQADATAGTNALINSVVAPVANTVYYVRSTISAACFSTAAITVTAVAAPVLNVTNGSVCAGGSIDLSSLVTSAGGGILSFHSTYANAVAGSPIIASTVSPPAATNYYIRSTNSSGCYQVKEVTVTLKTAACGVIGVNGPN